ncbi:MAG TPA: hypothetical protein VHP38_15320 [Ruminiclostridium sp.]|nr:hypothetical protein [Ruminiclostridium sp.]
MYDSTRKQYILKLSSNKVINIFYKENAGICVCTLGRKNIWSDPALVIKGALPGFCACIDDSGNIHMLCQDKLGNITYAVCKNENWSIKPVLHSKNPNPYEKHLSILCMGKELFFFYVIEYAGNRILSYQVYDENGELSSPRVVDYILDGRTPYIVFKDAENNLYSFYRFADSKYSQIGYRKYNLIKKQWDDFTPITDCNGDSSLISIAADSCNSIHVCWQKLSSQSSELVYSRKPAGSEVWSSEKLVNTSTVPYTDCSILVYGDKIIIFWVADGTIHYSVSENEGKSWSKPDKYSFQDAKPFSCILYRSNMPGELLNTYLNELPGTFSGGYKLAFIDDMLSAPENTIPGDFRLMVANTLKTLSRDNEELKQSISQVIKKIDAIEARQEKLGLDLEKYNIKVNLADSDLKSIKSQVETLKKVKEAMEIRNIQEYLPAEKSHVNNGSAPLMPGVGFANITADFLKNIQKK